MNFPISERKLQHIDAVLSDDDVQRVVNRGIHYIDVASTGGTSWSRQSASSK